MKSDTDASATRPLSRRAILAAAGASGAALALHRSAFARQAPAEAPAPAAEQGAGFYRFSVGDLGVTVIGDGDGALPAFPLFGEEAGKDAVTTALKNDFLDTETASLTFNVPLIRTSAGLILVDTGNGVKSKPNSGRLLDRLAAAGVKPADITAVIISHLHGDHFGGLSTPDGALTFPNARYYIQKSEHDFWTGPAPDLSNSRLDPEWKKGFIANAAAAAKSLAGKVELLTGKHQVAPGVTVEPAPGHTPGHQVVHLDSGGRSLLMIMDCAHHHCLSFRHPDWTVAFDTDAKLGAQMRRLMLERAAVERSLVMGYHMPFPAVGHVRRERDGFEWVPQPWKW